MHLGIWILGGVILTCCACMWQAGRAVVLVAVSQGAAHYQQALRKVVRKHDAAGASCRGLGRLSHLR